MAKTPSSSYAIDPSISLRHVPVDISGGSVIPLHSLNMEACHEIPLSQPRIRLRVDMQQPLSVQTRRIRHFGSWSIGVPRRLP